MDLPVHKPVRRYRRQRRSTTGVSGQNVRFNILGGEIITYTVMAPATAGSGTFSGTVAEQNWCVRRWRLPW